jgi:hypothetical protein
MTQKNNIDMLNEESCSLGARLRKVCQKKWRDWRNVSTGAMLVLMLIGFSLLCKISFNQFDETIKTEHSVSWPKNVRLDLQPGPVVFAYDNERGRLRYRGIMDDEAKKELVGLLPPEAKEKLIDTRPENARNPSCDAFQTKPEFCISAAVIYRSAIDVLAFESSASKITLMINSMLVAACFGALGSHVRSMSAYVNHKGKGDLDLDKFWPYYYVRPLYGAVFGALVVTVTKAGFLTASTTQSDPTMWWLSLAFFAGFGDREFAEKIRQIIKALFGESIEVRGKPVANAPTQETAQSIKPALEESILPSERRPDERKAA